MSARIVGSAVLAWLLAAAPLATAQQLPTGFDHPQHAKLFPRCESCHLGADRAGADLMPPKVSCAECHDGTISKRVDWSPRPGPAPSNLRFDHQRHAKAAIQAKQPAPTCGSCHQPDGAGWMTIARTTVAQCLTCHQLGDEHLAVSDSACATCHLPLVEARSLPVERVKAFTAPLTHKSQNFNLPGGTGHGVQARGPGRVPVAASCATCHARDFCIVCHVDAPETPTIQALGLDPRSLAHRAELKAPATHQAADFARRHGGTMGPKGERCATCHTKESCLTCHVTPPSGRRALAAAGPGRGPGAQLTRTRPISHAADFSQQHAPAASSKPTSCAACHARSDCLDCHRPDPGRGSGFHPAGFATRHPAAAYARESSCNDCHNVQQFCVTCHAQAGTTSRATLGKVSYHDGKQSFLFGHGQAARQSLESCVSCHAERDCLTCHASQGGRRFNPHGPGFDPDRLRRKNPEMCRACHGLSVPTRAR
ncbi:MAG: hypothetical protein ACKVZ0_15725 [Gemmatimonadales bacterium]